MTDWILENLEDVYEKCSWRVRSCSFTTFFPYKSSYVFMNSNHHKISLFNAWNLKFGFWHSSTMTKFASLLSKPSSNIKKEVSMGRKMLFSISNISFHCRDSQVLKICKLANWWCHTFNQILINMMKKDISANFVSDEFDSLQ